MNFSVRNFLFSALFFVSGTSMAATDLRKVVDSHVGPLMQQQGIAGLSVAVVNKGKVQYFNYGVANKDKQQPVTQDTLFEIGSVSKTFTATLGGYAEASGKLQLGQGQPAPCSPQGQCLRPHQPAATRHLHPRWPAAAVSGRRRQRRRHDRLFPALETRLRARCAASLLQPEHWPVRLPERPKPGPAVQHGDGETLLPKLGLKNTYVSVPADKADAYAQGYDKQDKPVRVGPGALDGEAYGIKTSTQDLAHYVMVNMHPQTLEKPLQQAIATTHTGYYTVNGMTQGLGWESYPYPITLQALMDGNSTPMAMEPHNVKWLHRLRRNRRTCCTTKPAQPVVLVPTWCMCRAGTSAW